MLGFACCNAGRYVEAIEVGERAVKLDPESLVARLHHHLALRLSRRFKEAVAAGELVLTISGRMPLILANLSTTFADWGKPEDTDAVYAELMSRTRRSDMQPSVLAIAAAAAGNPTRPFSTTARLLRSATLEAQWCFRGTRLTATGCDRPHTTKTSLRAWEKHCGPDHDHAQVQGNRSEYSACLRKRSKTIWLLNAVNV